MATTKAQQARALAIRAELRSQGVPSVVTADEAYRLSDGAAGTTGDHSSPVSLAAVATALAKRG